MKQMETKLKKVTDELNRKIFEMDEMKAFVERFNDDLEIQELIDLVLAKALKLTGPQIGSLCLVEKEENRLLVAAFHGFEGEPKRHFHIDLEESLIQQVIYEINRWWSGIWKGIPASIKPTRRGMDLPPL